ncbi:hypothetical protein SAMN05216174_101587 [Actinokineospora iranica]|uniref:Uncharacterized protein n=1 Tax=Actinokineospora iranica TaxID=1271860 RepID=A0A1G6JXZ4_9PSEU|nr:hypothetical protein SAMN05216174_101587 [Actinokineospora iranica]
MAAGWPLGVVGRGWWGVAWLGWVGVGPPVCGVLGREDGPEPLPVGVLEVAIFPGAGLAWPAAVGVLGVFWTVGVGLGRLAVADWPPAPVVAPPPVTVGVLLPVWLSTPFMRDAAESSVPRVAWAVALVLAPASSAAVAALSAPVRAVAMALSAWRMATWPKTPALSALALMFSLASTPDRSWSPRWAIRPPRDSTASACIPTPPPPGPAPPVVDGVRPLLGDWSPPLCEDGEPPRSLCLTITPSQATKPRRAWGHGCANRGRRRSWGIGSADPIPRR